MLESDLDFSFSVYISTRLEEMKKSGWSQDQIHGFLLDQARMQHRHYRTYYSDGVFYILSAELKGSKEDIGRLYLHYSNSELRIVDIALLPEYRGRGIGRALLEVLKIEAKKSSKSLTIHVEENNPALRLYEELGFSKIKKVNSIYWFMSWTPS
ncbi:GNAT family N-acetyltransferase [Marinomonas mediterranea]|nr:GNAT family N-acetyltransferase [Marinomonas mediterranea]WCN15438.1 GNAT family N-acetyltransferase [Marinomonas mediterranea]